MSYNSRESNCDKEGGCVSQGKPCLLSTTKLPYLQAGIAIISDWSIVQKLKGANSEYQKMLKIFGRETETAKEKKEEYVMTLGKTFNITDKNARAIIENDQHRSEAAKREDLLFYDDFFSENATRRMAISTRDTRYDRSVVEEVNMNARREERQEKAEQRREKERKRLSQQVSNQVVQNDVEENEEYEGEGNDREEEEEKIQSGERKMKTRMYQ